MHLRHRWTTVEIIGRAVTEQCAVCLKTRTRVRGPVRECARTPTPDYPCRPVNDSGAATAAPKRTGAEAVPHRTPPRLDRLGNG